MCQLLHCRWSYSVMAHNTESELVWVLFRFCSAVTNRDRKRTSFVIINKLHWARSAKIRLCPQAEIAFTHRCFCFSCLMWCAFLDCETVASVSMFWEYKCLRGWIISHWSWSCRLRVVLWSSCPYTNVNSAKLSECSVKLKKAFVCTLHSVCLINDGLVLQAGAAHLCQKDLKSF